MTSQTEYDVIYRFVGHDFLLTFNTCDIVFSNRFVVVSDFRSVCNGESLISTAGERVMGSFISSIDFLTPILYRHSVDTFRLSLTVRKLYVVFTEQSIWLGFSPKFGGDF